MKGFGKYCIFGEDEQAPNIFGEKNHNVSSIIGFTLLRNGLKYDYPFVESLSSLSEFCETVYVALGNSDDGTEASLTSLKNLRLIPTVWDENLRKSGLILSEQTNIALDALRTNHHQGWAIYLQADEVLNPLNFAQLRADLAKASEENCDAVSFRYLHFWQAYDKIAITKRWYPQEIRAIRIESKLRSYGDAQSFAKAEKTFQSDVPIFHYGHVRTPEAYERKRWDFGKWWHPDDQLEKMLAKGNKREKQEHVLRYLGPHPVFMKKRIGDTPAPQEKKHLLVFGDRKNFSTEFLSSVDAATTWTLDPTQLSGKNWDEVVLLEQLPLLQRIRFWGKFRSKVPLKMESERALPWNREFVAALKFAEKGVATHRFR